MPTEPEGRPNPEQPGPPAAERFRELRALCTRLEHGRDRTTAEAVLPLVDALERVYDHALGMRQGGESFDNRTLIEVFREVEVRVLAALWEIAEACETVVAWSESGQAPSARSRSAQPPPPPADYVGGFGS